jgi:hypothetical protein
MTAPTFTLGQLTDDTFRQLRGTSRDTVNMLAGALDAPAALTPETITLQNSLQGIVIGALLVVGDETMYVVDISNSTKQASVIRGYDGTTPAVASIGALVSVDPPWTRKIVQDRIKDELRSWPPQVFAVRSIEAPIVNLQRGYDLGSISSSVEIIRLLTVTAPEPPYIGDPGYWNFPGNNLASQVWINYPYVYNPNADTSMFPSGRSVTLNGTAQPVANGNLHIVYAAPFDVDTSWTDSTDLIASVGLDSRWLDIVPLGATARLLRSISVRRAMLNVQGQSRDDQDVTMQAILLAAQQYENTRASRLSDAQMQLMSDWPYRVSTY